MSKRRRNPMFEMTQTGEFLRRSFDQDPRLGTVLHIANKLSAQITQIELLELIIKALSDLLDAERSTLFLVSNDGEHLWSEVAEGDERIEIKVKVGEGLAGWVAQTGRSINVKDAYRDPRFDRRWDDQSGFRTTSVLCQPLRNREGQVIGVAQAINKAEGAYFTIDDEIMMRTIMALAAISVVNGNLYRSLLARNLELREAKLELQERIREIDLLYAIEREVAQEDTLDAAINTLLVVLMTALPCRLVQLSLKAEDGAFICHSYERGDDAVKILREERPHGLIRQALKSPEMVELEQIQPVDVAKDSVLKPADSGVAIGLRNRGELLGVLCVLDRNLSESSPLIGRFDDDDIKLLELVSRQSARVVARFQAREQADRESRLASLGGAISSILHDFRTPMTIASGYVQMMSSTDDPERRSQLAATVLKQLDRVTAMSRDVLGFARGSQSIFVQRVHMNDFVEEAQELVEQIFAKTPVTTSVESSFLGVARFDRLKAMRVVQNMARNARDAMLSTGKTLSQSASFTLQVSEVAERLHWRFVDNGPGVSPEFRHRMFDAFATQGKKDGTGLGLAMVRRFTDAHGGSVRYEDTRGGGATFVLDIALHTLAPSESLQAIADTPGSPQHEASKN